MSSLFNLYTSSTEPPRWVRAWQRNRFKYIIGGSIAALIAIRVFSPHPTGTRSGCSFFQLLPYFSRPPQRSQQSQRLLTTVAPGAPPPSQTPSPKRPRFVSESRGERECRRVLESIFKVSFPKQRPLFLKNTVTGRPLEIDCYNDDLKLGVEYNGRQHYAFTKGMHKTQDAFQTQRYRDEMKQRLCDANRVVLITVPYTVPVENIEQFLRKEIAFKKDQLVNL